MLAKTRRLLHYLSPYRWQVLASVLFIILISLLQLAGPYITALAVDGYLLPPEGGKAWLFPFFSLVALYLLVEAGAAFLLRIQTILMQEVGQKVMLDLRKELYHHVLHQDLAFFRKQPTGKIMTRLTNDVDALNELFTSGFVTFFGDSFLLVGIVVMMLLIHWKLALVTFAILPFLGALSGWFQAHALKAYRRVRKALADLNSFMQEYLSGILIVQLYQQTHRISTDFKEHNSHLRYAHIQSIFYYALFYPGIMLLSATGIALIIGYGGYQVTKGMVSLGVLLAYIQYVRKFYEPLNELAEKYNIFQAALAASERIFQLLDTHPLITDPDKPGLPPSQDGTLQVEGVYFAYDDENWVLKDVSFTLQGGEKVKIVGYTGAGKSTLVNLFKRFEEPQKGEITLDGISLKAYPLQQLRQLITEVPQDVQLFTGTLLDNLRLFDERIGEKEVIHRLQELELWEWVENLPEGLSTPIDPNTLHFSRGMQQVVNILRAIVLNPRVLILDEATASMDGILEAKLQKALDQLMEGKTTITIAHRLATVNPDDRILVFHKGQLVQDGIHEELIQVEGVYRHLYQLFQMEAQQRAIGS